MKKYISQKQLISFELNKARLEAQRATRKCDDCENDFKMSDLQPYKLDRGVWLCQDCYDQRMDE